MKIIEPKTKTGRSTLGVTITHYRDNTFNRWYINGEKVTLEKIAKLLGYASKSQLYLYIRKHGVKMLLTHGVRIQFIWGITGFFVPR